MSQNFQKPITSPPTIFLVAVLTGIALGLVYPWRILPWPVQAGLGPLVALVGVMIIRQSIQEIEAAATTYDPYGVSTELVTTGLYRRSRNPGYLGLAVIQLGVAILFDNMWIIVSGLIAIFVTNRLVIRLEEKKLSDAFGQAYRDYCKRVRRWL